MVSRESYFAEIEYVDIPDDLGHPSRPDSLPDYVDDFLGSEDYRKFTDYWKSDRIPLGAVRYIAERATYMAAKTFDPEHTSGASFATYAKRAIRNAVADRFRQEKRARENTKRATQERKRDAAIKKLLFESRADRNTIAREMYRAGATQADIGIALNMSQPGVRKLLLRLGVELRGIRNRRSGGYNPRA